MKIVIIYKLILLKLLYIVVGAWWSWVLWIINEKMEMVMRSYFCGTALKDVRHYKKFLLILYLSIGGGGEK
jgi:hypothetical protein